MSFERAGTVSVGRFDSGGTARTVEDAPGAIGYTLKVPPSTFIEAGGIVEVGVVTFMMPT